MSKQSWSRRKFLGRLALGGLATAAAGLSGWRWFKPAEVPPITGHIMGANASVGHLLREAQTAPFTEKQRTKTVIVGAGVAGLAAAWKLQRAGQTDFRVLELDKIAGGNAVWGENEVSRYPWGAHYLPVPERTNIDLTALCADLGLMQGYDAAGRPIYPEEYLCHDPKERLFIHGQWQEGLVPRLGVPDGERRQLDRFFALIEVWREKVGRDGKPVFCIPVDLSSQDPEYLALDRMPFRDYLYEIGFDAPHLHWYVNYSCRDDYGVAYDQVSAWAGLHYFAGRRSDPAYAESSAVLTWPEGNGWLVRNMAARLGEQLRCNALVTQIRNAESGVTVDFYDPERRNRTQILADQAIYCGPHFTVPYLVPEAPRQIPPGFQYAPWLVANVTVRRRPAGPGHPLSWDNVAYESNSLGYVVADHQGLQRKPNARTVLTWYQPLDDQPAKAARQALHDLTWEQQRDLVLADLESMHPGITRDVERIDTWAWGHGMISPRVGFLWGGEREIAGRSIGNIHFAHSDLSGISIFEEAFYQGVKAAKRILGVPG